MAKRIRIYRPGSWDQLQFEDFDCAEPRADEVKIDVRAAGVNFADVCVRQGLYASAKEFVGWPITPGFEVAGTIVATGQEVKNFTVGDRVMAVVFFGGYASQLTVKTSYVRLVPPTMSFEQAASLPGVFLTGYYATHWLPRIHPGSTALIHSAAGGVGLTLIQLLKDLDCKVIGVVGSSHKVDVAREYGADAVIDKSAVDLWAMAEQESPDGYDLIYDPNGVSTFRQSYGHLAQSGSLFVYGFQSMLSKQRGRQNPLLLIRDYLRTPRFNPFDMVRANKSVMGFNLSYLYEREDILEEGLSSMLDRLTTSTFRPLPVTPYEFEDVAAAHRAIESGRTVGKLVLILE